MFIIIIQWVLESVQLYNLVIKTGLLYLIFFSLTNDSQSDMLHPTAQNTV